MREIAASNKNTSSLLPASFATRNAAPLFMNITSSSTMPLMRKFPRLSHLEAAALALFKFSSIGYLKWPRPIGKFQRCHRMLSYRPLGR